MSTTTISAAAAGAREAARHGDGRFGAQSRAEAGGMELLDRTVSVLDVEGKPVELTPGVIDERAEYVFQNGQCLALAVATARRTGCGLVVSWNYDEDGEWIGHVWAAEDPEAVLSAQHAQVRDVMGLDTIRDYEQRWDFDNEHDYGTVSADQLEAALPELEAAMDHPQDYAVADTFVDAVLARGRNEG